MSASFDSNHVTKLGELYDFLTGIWNKCKNKFAAKSDLATVATSGSYNDLSDKPTIPSVPVTDVTVDGTSVVSNGTAAITMPTVDQVYDGTSANAQSGVAMAGALSGKQDNMVVLEYGTSTWNDFITAYNKNAVVYCKYAVNASNSRLAHLAFVNLSSTDADKNAEFWFVRSIGTHTASDQCDEVMVYKLTFNGTWSTTTREMCLQGIAGNGITRTVTQSAGAGTIAWSVKPATNGGVNVDSNGVSVDVKEAPSDSKEYVRKNGAWSEATEEILLMSPGNDADADAATITAALTAGKHVILRITDGNYQYDLPLMFWRDTETFKFAGWVDSYRELIKILEYNNNAWTWSATTKKTVVPNYSSGDAGKVLTVNSGGTAATWEALATTAEIQAIVV